MTKHGWPLLLGIFALPLFSQAPKGVTPYTAKQIIEADFTGSDGARAHQSTTIAIAVEASGRWLHEFETASGVKTIEIHDPVAKLAYTLFPDRHEGVRRAYNSFPTFDVSEPSLSSIGPPRQSVSGDNSFERITEEDLGQKKIDGLIAQGRRTTETWKPGPGVTYRGKPLTHEVKSEYESWTVKDPPLVLLQTIKEEGQTRTLRVEDIKIGPPSSKLFDLGGYAVRNAGVNAKEVGELYREAKDGVAALPRPLRASELLEIAEDESYAGLPDAPADLKDAFEELLASKDEEFYSKPPYGARIVTALMRSRPSSLLEAVELAREADVPKTWVYDPILHNANFSSPEAQATHLTPESLVAECINADGTFPFNGVSGLISNSNRLQHLPPGTKTNLLTAAYDDFIAHPPMPLQIAVLGRISHRDVPQLDGRLEAALVAAFKANPNGDNRGAIALLADIDPSEAEAVSAQVDAAPAARRRPPAPQLSDRFRLQQLAMTDPASALQQALALPDGPDKISVLAIIASQSHDDETMQRAAAAALPLANNLISQADLNTLDSFSQIAQRLSRNGRYDDAAVLTNEILSRLTQRMTDAQAALDAHPELLEGISRGFLPAKADQAVKDLIEPEMVAQIWRTAAGIDVESTADRARALPPSILKPMVLAAVASAAR